MSDWFGIIYREVLPQGALLQEEQKEDGGGKALPANSFKQQAAGASTPHLPWQQQQRRPSPRRPSSSMSTRVPYAESVFDAARMMCADEEVGGECE